MYQRLRELRLKKGYSLEQMGEVISKSPANYYKKEMGEVAITLKEAELLSDFLKVKPNKIFFTKELSQNETTQTKIT